MQQRVFKDYPSHVFVEEKGRQRRKLVLRYCLTCGSGFHSRKGNRQFKYCSKSCSSRSVSNIEHCKKIAKETAPARGAKQRGTGTIGYIKYNGRHQHRLVAELILGRALLPSEVVHHKDENKHNNSPDNLEVLTRAEHMRKHGLGIPGVAPKWLQRSK